VVVQPVNSIPLGTSIAPKVQPRDGETGEGDAEKEKGPGSYTRLEITSPANDEAMGHDVDSATIAAVLEPGLQDGHKIKLYLNDNPVGDGSLSYTVSPLERGTYRVQAKVFDQKDKMLKASAIVEFHVRRASINDPGRKNFEPGKKPPGGAGSPSGIGSFPAIGSPASK
jgi:hypothetical protein